jgi:hypothetical protein
MKTLQITDELANAAADYLRYLESEVERLAVAGIPETDNCKFERLLMRDIVASAASTPTAETSARPEAPKLRRLWHELVRQGRNSCEHADAIHDAAREAVAEIVSAKDKRIAELEAERDEWKKRSFRDQDAIFALAQVVNEFSASHPTEEGETVALIANGVPDEK